MYTKMHVVSTVVNMFSAQVRFVVYNAKNWREEVHDWKKLLQVMKLLHAL